MDIPDPLPDHDPITGATDKHCDKFIDLANELGLTRAQVAIVCGTIWANHAIATGVTRARGHLLVDNFWAWREAQPVSDHVLVKLQPECEHDWQTFTGPHIDGEAKVCVKCGRLPERD